MSASLGSEIGTERVVARQGVDQGPRQCHGHNATIVGTPGNDYAYNQGGQELEGTSGPDVIVGMSGKDRILGNGGADVICGGPGGDSVEGGHKGDRVFGGAGRDYLVGERGDDRLHGEAGQDNLLGELGYDICLGGHPRKDTFDKGDHAAIYDLGGSRGKDCDRINSAFHSTAL